VIILSVYSRCLKSQNFSGENDPTARLYIVPESSPYPDKLINAGAVRFMANGLGEITYKASPGISRHDKLKEEIMTAARIHGENTTVEALEKDLRSA
jgi:hypothetical protein